MLCFFTYCTGTLLLAHYILCFFTYCTGTLLLAHYMLCFFNYCTGTLLQAHYILCLFTYCTGTLLLAHYILCLFTYCTGRLQTEIQTGDKVPVCRWRTGPNRADISCNPVTNTACQLYITRVICTWLCALNTGISQHNWSVVCINWVSCKKWIWENRNWSYGHANG